MKNFGISSLNDLNYLKNKEREQWTLKISIDLINTWNKNGWHLPPMSL